MKTYRRKYIVSFIIIQLILLVGLALSVAHMVHYNTTVVQKKSLDKKATYITAMLNKDGLSEATQEEIERLADGLDLFIAVVNNEGDVLYDSGKLNEEDDLAFRKFVSESLPRLKKSTANRIYKTDYRFYILENIPLALDEEGYLVVSTPKFESETATVDIFAIIFVLLLLGTIALLYLGRRLINQYTQPIDSITKVAVELTKGNYSARIYEEPNNELGVLQTTLNILARNLQEATKAQEIQTDRLQTIIENMGMPLISIDQQGIVTLVNRTYTEIFGKTNEELYGRSYVDCIEHRKIRNIIEEVFMTEKGVRKEVKLSIGIWMKHFEIYGAPIISNDNEWKGIVLVFHDITELKKLEQVRKDFVANVSHELKTPVTSIKGFAETLLDGAMNERETLHSFLQIIQKESDRLQSLIYDLLELSRIEREGFQLTIDRVDLHQIVHDVLHTLEKNAAKKRISLAYENGRSCIIEGDRLRIQQILFNLVTNAISYTPPRGKVTVTLSEENDHVKLSVNDTGIGIEKEEIPRIFERFYRVDKARSRNSGGTGLGLAIVKHLVDAHKGDIVVDSELGKGSCFTVLLPKKYPRFKEFTKN